MKDEAVHYFNLAIKRLQNHIQQATAQQAKTGTPAVVDSKQAVTIFLLELLKEQVSNEDSGSSTR